MDLTTVSPTPLGRPPCSMSFDVLPPSHTEALLPPRASALNVSLLHPTPPPNHILACVALRAARISNRLPFRTC